MASFSMVILGSLIFLLTGSGDLFTSNATLYTYMDDSAAMAAAPPCGSTASRSGKSTPLRSPA